VKKLELKSAPAQVHGAIREALASGQFRPGSRLLEASVAEELGVSRIPLREALATLVAEGLLERRHRRGAHVPSLNRSDLTEIYLARNALESILFERAAEHITSDDVRKLVAINEEVSAASKSGALSEMADANRRFHFLIMDRASLPRITAMVTRIWDMTAFYRVYFWLDTSHRELTIKGHRRIIQACKAHDARRLVELHNEHRAALVEGSFAWMLLDGSLGPATKPLREGKVDRIRRKRRSKS
jgi:DNA-binding GntR family transcriptional regulator